MEHVLALQALEIDVTDALSAELHYSTYGWSTLSVACCGWSHISTAVETRG